MVIWLEDLTDDDVDEEGQREAEAPETEDLDDRVLDLTDQPDADEPARGEVAPHHDEQVDAQVQAARDEGTALADLDASRFTRH